MMSVDPAITLSTIGRVRATRSAPGDTVPDHLLRVDDFVETLFVDVAGLESGLLQAQVLIIGLVRDRGSLVVADHRTKCRHQHQRTVDHLVDALAVEARALDGKAPQLIARVAEDA